MKFTLSLLLALFLFGNQAQAESEMTVRRGVAFTIFSSIGGAVLGLSTLPFYDKPQDHTNNINIGALLGLLAGGGYVLYKSTNVEAQALKPKPPVQLEGLLSHPGGFTLVWSF
ncbi:MAG TPA: hypothetical protein PLJ21_10755 [Pseudobdellovibrionaceae bacterium]|nr:hypothetical protein [Pseudobdellovibrionaceae bacterium]